MSARDRIGAMQEVESYSKRFTRCSTRPGTTDVSSSCFVRWANAYALGSSQYIRPRRTFRL